MYSSMDIGVGTQNQILRLRAGRPTAKEMAGEPGERSGPDDICKPIQGFRRFRQLRRCGPRQRISAGSWRRDTVRNSSRRSRSAKLVKSLPSLVAFLAWRPRAIGVLPDLCQGALEKELDLLIRRAVLPFREFRDSRFRVGSYSDKQFCERRSLGLFLGFRPPW